jgi:hypothetical protein
LCSDDRQYRHRLVSLLTFKFLSVASAHDMLQYKPQKSQIETGY